MTPSLQRKRRICMYLGAIAAIITLVVLIVVLWVLQARGTFATADDQKRSVTVTANEDQVHVERTFSESSNDTIVDATKKHENNPNVQFVTPLKISPQPLHHQDLIYDLTHNETTTSSKHRSGHFRHKTAEIWDPHPEYELEAFGTKLHLALILNEDVPKNIHITHMYGNYSRRIEHDPRISACYYKGSIKGDVNSSVSVNLCHGMTGHIHTSTGNYYITPVENSSEDSVSAIKHKIIREPYRPDDNAYGENSNISHCEEKIIIDDELLPDSGTNNDRTKREILFFDEIDSFDEPQYDMEFVESKRSARGVHHSHRSGKGARTKRTDHEYFIEVLIVADKKMTEYHKNKETLIQYILTLMSHVGILFKDATVGNPITLVVVHISILNDTEFTANRSDEMLKSFCEWQRRHNGHIHHDAAILLTRDIICKNLTSGICHTLGIAEVGGMCSETSSCAIVKDNGLSTSYTIAHEMGHLLNMRHDDFHACGKYNGNSKSKIMSKVHHNETKPWHWSACSRHYLTEFLDSPRASCLLGKPKDVKLEFSNTLPGENFEVNRQCELEFGADSKICSFMPKCSSLWCTSEAGEENGCRTQHMPWADGTRCGYRSWCHHGECITMDRQSLAPRNGIWGPWGPWEDCSRTCGGGVQLSRRECNQPPPANGGSYCTGQSTRYMSCNTHECNPAAPNFREVQCAEFDGNTKGITGLTSNVKWVPKYGITDEHDVCRLFCRVKGSNEYFVLKDKVIDGTKCSINNFDICVKGKCMPAGCDNKLNSTQTLDECGVCNGDNSTCQEVHGTFNHSTRGYSRIVRIPRGSSNLVIEQHSLYSEKDKDDNYLALVDGETEEYILNGHFIISSWKRDMVYGGLTISYSGAETRAERVTTPKTRKLTKDLILEVLTVTGTPPDINYRYTINKEMAPKYGWNLFQSNWRECSAICGGVRYQKPVCLDLINHSQVSDSKCSDLTMSGLVTEKPCNTHCELAWNKTRSECSAHCGQGWQDIHYNCIKINKVNKMNLLSSESVHRRIEHAVNDKHCSNLPTPASRERCIGPCDSTHWYYTPWSECSQTCGTGSRIRTATCVDIHNNTIGDFHCHSKRKIIQQKCNVGKCPQWSYGDWGPCSEPCGKSSRVKEYYCSRNGQILSNEMCNRELLKIHTEECEEIACEWKVSNWSSCNASCGEGVQTREVQCQARNKKVNESYCRGLLKPSHKTSCINPCEDIQDDRSLANSNEIPNVHNYDYEWWPGQWSECSKSCGGGVKTRAVTCSKGSDFYCHMNNKPAHTSKCNDFDCPYWRVGEWTPCNAFCEKNRLVKCSSHARAMPLCDKATKLPSTSKCTAEECYRSHTTVLPTEVKKIQKFRWKKTAWGPCSNFCGKGSRTRKVTCRDIQGNVTVVDGFCQGLAKPKHIRFCQHYSKHNCSFTWVDGPWSKCSKPCGMGYRSRNVTCQRVFPSGTIQHGVISNYYKCDPYHKPPIKEQCNDRNCNDPHMWRTGPWSKCPDTCGVKGFQIRKLYCINQREQTLAKKFCQKSKRPERKRKCPIVYCRSCKDIQMNMKTKENKEYILNLYGKSASVYCYLMDSKEPKEFISLPAGKDNYAQYYDRRLDRLSQTSFWKVRLDIDKMRIISNDFTFSKPNGTQQYYAEAGTNYRELNRYIYFVIDMTDTTFRLADSVRWICTERNGRNNVHIGNDRQYFRGICPPTCGSCLPDPNYGLPVEIT